GGYPRQPMTSVSGEIRFTQGQTAFLLRHLSMEPAGTGSKTHIGVGRDGTLRRCYFHDHSDSTPVPTGTADAIAEQLGFTAVAEMKDYLDKRV
ncbi:MAG: hypothetical protein Q8P31_03040, partial [Bacillota bacterium]|nr:hypothetical protein [Bacillota bacterium]